MHPEQGNTNIIESQVLYTGWHRVFQGWVNWTIGIFALLLQFCMQMSSGVIIDELSKSFEMTALDAGLISGAYYYIYVLLQIPAGIMVEKFGARKLMVLGGIIIATGCWIFSHADHVLEAELGRMIMGIGGSMSFVCTIFLVQQWFPANRFAAMVGLTETVGLLGTLIADVYLASVIETWGWRYSVNVIAVLTLTVTALAALFMRDRPYLIAEHFVPQHTGFFKSLNEVVKRNQCWLNGIYCGLIFSLITVFVALWGIPFYAKKYAISLTLSTVANGMLFAGAAVGCPLVGWFSDYIGKRRPLLLWGAVFSFLLLCMVIYLSVPLWLLFVLLFALGLTCSVYVLNFAIVHDLVPSQSVSTGIGFTNALCVASAPLFQPAIGLLLWASARGDAPEKGYNITQFHVGLSLLPLALLIAAIIAYKMRESYTEKAVQVGIDRV